MNAFRKAYGICMLLILGVSISFAQITTTIKPLEVGQQMPAVVVSNLTNTKDKTFNFADYKGKLVIIDYWATWCAPCIATMPKLDELQKKFSDKLKIVLVGQEGKEKIDKFLSTRERLQGLKTALPIIYNDVQLRSYFPHTAIPHTVLIDGNGKVVAITSPEELNEQKLMQVMNGAEIKVSAKTDRYSINRDELFFNERMAKPLFVNEGVWIDGNTKFKSVLTGYVENAGGLSSPQIGRLLQINTTISGLYRAAFSYQIDPSFTRISANRVVFEVSNSMRSLIDQPRSLKTREELIAWNLKHFYTYDLVLPNYYIGPGNYNGKDHVRRMACQIMQKDLATYFPKLSVSVDQREVECLALKCLDASLINSKENFGEQSNQGGKMAAGSTLGGGTYTSKRFGILYEMLRLALQRELPLIDDTNYNGPVNVKLDVNMSNLEAVSEELKKFGMTIIKEKRVIPMLVIKERK